MNRTDRILTVALVAVLAPALTRASITVLPDGLTFVQASGTTSTAQTVSVYNLGNTSITVTSVTAGAAQFVVSGPIPATVQPNQYQNYSVAFAPILAKTVNATLKILITGQASQTINLTGKGTNTNAVPTLSATSLGFGTLSLGHNSSSTLTITNNGTASFSLTNVTVTPPFFETGWTKSTPVAPGKSLSLQVYYSPMALGSVTGSVWLVYDVAPDNGVSLSGTAQAAASLGIYSFPTLPAANSNSAYSTALQATGGTAPYSWSLASGSSLPTGLALSASGAIGGTVSSTVLAGNYSFTAKVQDSSSPPATVTSALTIPMYAAPNTQKNCNNISVNASDGTALVPLADLGAGYYLGKSQGGLYANGSNVRPADHDSYGVDLAQAIQPLDSSGNPSPTGKYVLVGVGMSIVQQAFAPFVGLANADPHKNQNLVVVNGGTHGANAVDLSDSGSNFWTVIANDYLPNAGVTANQVVAVWFLDADPKPTGSYPSDITTFQSEMETIAQNLLVKFPNLKLAYYSALNYTGYSDGYSTLHPEPYSYEAGFAVKNVVQDQLNGNANLNFDPSKGPVLAPWLSWGPYFWSNGLTQRGDGFYWSCNDADTDGVHPSNPAGRTRIAGQILNFLKLDDTAAPWFLAPGIATSGPN
jgi:hypothetical protein